jgi:hypothetical protein
VLRFPPRSHRLAGVIPADQFQGQHDHTAVAQPSATE